MAKVSDAILTYQVDHPLEEPIGGVPTTSVMLQVCKILPTAFVCNLFPLHCHDQASCMTNNFLF